MPQTRFEFLFGNVEPTELKREVAESSLDILENEFGGGVWDAEAMAPLHVGDIIVFPSKQDILTNASGRWQKYPKLGKDVKGYRTLLQVNGRLKLVSHKTLNKSFRLKSDPDKQIIDENDILRKTFAMAGATIGANLRCLAWLQEKNLAPAWRLKSADGHQVLKFGSNTEETTERNLIFEPCTLTGEAIKPTQAWAEWKTIASTYALNDAAAPVVNSDDSPF